MKLGLAMILAVLPALASAAEVPDAAQQTQAQALSGRFQSLLQVRLMAALARGDAAAAVAVCRDEAPAIASQLSRESGWQVRGIGTRVRNPLTGVPLILLPKVLVAEWRFSAELCGRGLQPIDWQSSSVRCGERVLVD
jgi:hypothetical protein